MPTAVTARLPQVAHERGINVPAGHAFTVVRLWNGDRGREHRIKNHHKHPVLCPICNPANAWQNEPAGSLDPDKIDGTLTPF